MSSIHAVLGDSCRIVVPELANREIMGKCPFIRASKTVSRSIDDPSHVASSAVVCGSMSVGYPGNGAASTLTPCILRVGRSTVILHCPQQSGGLLQTSSISKMASNRAVAEFRRRQSHTFPARSQSDGADHRLASSVQAHRV